MTPESIWRVCVSADEEFRENVSVGRPCPSGTSKSKQLHAEVAHFGVVCSATLQTRATEKQMSKKNWPQRACVFFLSLAPLVFPRWDLCMERA